jgi:hypothetical protein
MPKNKKLPALKPGGLYKCNCQTGDAFVEASLSLVLRDREGTLLGQTESLPQVIIGLLARAFSVE